jgi:hypothetical protein
MQDSADGPGQLAALGYQPVYVVLRAPRPPEHPEPYWSPVSGTTGREAPFPAYPGADGAEDLAGRDYRLALRPSPAVLIIDVDHYGAKTGADTIRRAGAQWGPLPPTWKLTARGPGDPGGKLLYRLPPGRTTGLMRDRALRPFGGDVELVRAGHRFSWAPGDVNAKTGTPVRVYGAAGGESPLPAAAGLPELSAAWCDGLAVGDDREMSAGDTELPDDEGRCPAAVAWLARQDFTDASPRGNRANAAANYLKITAAEGHDIGGLIDTVIAALPATSDADFEDMWATAPVPADTVPVEHECCSPDLAWLATWARQQAAPAANGQDPATVPPGVCQEPASRRSLKDRIKTGAYLNGTMFAPLRFHVDGLVPEGLTVLGATVKTGKSWLVLRWLLDLAADGRAVLYLALEDSDRRMQSRCRELLGGEPVPAGFQYLTEEDLERGSILDDIGEFTRDNGDRAPLVVVDTLAKVLHQAPRLGNEPDYERDYRVTGELQKTVKGCPGAGLVVLTHTRKAVADDWVDTILGTKGITAAPDTIIGLFRARDSAEGDLRITGRDIAEDAYAMDFRAPGHWSYAGGSLPAAAAAYRVRRARAGLGDRSADIVAFTAAHSPPGVRAAAVAAGLDMNEHDASEYLRRLERAGRITRISRGLYGSVGSVGFAGQDPPAQPGKPHNPHNRLAPARAREDFPVRSLPAGAARGELGQVIPAPGYHWDAASHGYLPDEAPPGATPPADGCPFCNNSAEGCWQHPRDPATVVWRPDLMRYVPAG